MCVAESATQELVTSSEIPHPNPVLADGKRIGDAVDSSPGCPFHSSNARSSPRGGKACHLAAKGKRRST